MTERDADGPLSRRPTFPLNYRVILGSCRFVQLAFGEMFLKRRPMLSMDVDRRRNRPTPRKKIGLDNHIAHAALQDDPSVVTALGRCGAETVEHGDQQL